MIVLLFANLIGGALTFALLWPYGLVVGFAAAPLGGSLLMFWAALFISLRWLRGYVIPPLLR